MRGLLEPRDPGGDGLEDRALDGRELCQQLMELSVTDDHQPACRKAGCRGRPSRMAEQGQLSEEVTRAQVAQELPIALDPHGALEDQEELIA